MRQIVQGTLRAALENKGQVSDNDLDAMTHHVSIILHALHAAHAEKLALILAPARTKLTAVDQLVLSHGLPPLC